MYARIIVISSFHEIIRYESGNARYFGSYVADIKQKKMFIFFSHKKLKKKIFAILFGTVRNY